MTAQRLSATFVLLAAIAVPSLWLASAGAQAFENNIDRPGLDYRSFTLSSGSGPQACQNLCRRDLRNGCRAWTYVKAGFQDPTRPRYWLKSRVPRAIRNRCCVSGLEQIIEINLTTEERIALQKSAAAVQELVNVLGI